MQALRLAEIPPVLRGGRVSDPLVGHAQNTNKVDFNDRQFVYSKVLERLPETLYPPKVHLRFADADGLQDNGTLRNLFTGRNSINSGGNPIVDWSTGSWGVPLDSYVNGAVRWRGTDIVSAGSFVTDLWYEIRTVGTTDFTAIGASANTVGTFFQATGAGSGSGDAFETVGARHGDIAMCKVTESGTDYVQMYVNVYDYNNGNNNRLSLLESTDGTNFTEIGEIQFNFGNFGATIADVLQVGSRLIMICGENAGVGRGFQKRFRFSDDRGRTWSDVGTIIELSSDPASCRYYGMPVGRFLPYNGEDHVYFMAPASRISADWPEANLLFRRAVDDLYSPGLWEEWTWGPALIRGPQYGGVWNADYFSTQEGHFFGFTNEFGADNFDDVNTSNMNSLRGTPYFNQDTFSFKHTGLVKTTSTLALRDWDYRPFDDGDTVWLRHFGKYLASGLTDGANTYLTDDATDPGIGWVVEKQAEFWLLKQAAAQTLSLCTGGAGAYANRRAIGLPIEVRAHDAASAANNIRHHWQVCLYGENEPTTCVLLNRESSLGITADCSQRPALHGNVRQMFEIQVVTAT